MIEGSHAGRKERSHAGRQAGMHAGRQAGRQACRQAGRKEERQARRSTYVRPPIPTSSLYYSSLCWLYRTVQYGKDYVQSRAEGARARVATLLQYCTRVPYEQQQVSDGTGLSRTDIYGRTDGRTDIRTPHNPRIPQLYPGIVSGRMTNNYGTVVTYGIRYVRLFPHSLPGRAAAFARKYRIFTDSDEQTK